ncbi:4-hydroxy-2-oxovalerate aldolase [Gulosibacter chungangensis]|uniref:4-hydroxy-2-oxovalerate aldolase n=1 Tax=Gulosibacter chungangensis TaxID=979746 RepID=A0A7J5BC18_9MICO|nr:4-hydroxy-2-oxovalerate aldolase [Gulosibacter chungangensis]KAB1643656.1 4-hydroxy-2-oxovalerate aldolase [Gulosibacter chungangensis]
MNAHSNWQLQPGYENIAAVAGVPEGRDVRLVDTTLRDGSHAVRHRFTKEQVRDTVHALDTSGVDVIEVTHGDGLAGASFNYGFSLVPDIELIKIAAEEAKQARIAALMLPGVATSDDLRAARDAGASVARIATHSSEADTSVQHFGIARSLGFETMGFLMLSHRLEPEALAKQARIMADAGCQTVYVVDSAGALVLEEASDRVEALVAELGTDANVGYHGHQNLSLGVANSILAYRAGASHIDGSLIALGAGAGNSPTELLAVVFERLGITTGVDIDRVLSAANDVVDGFVPNRPWIDRSSIVQGYAGVYSSFLHHAQAAADRYGVPAHDLLMIAGERGLVGGQEDMLIDIALSLTSSAAKNEELQNA